MSKRDERLAAKLDTAGERAQKVVEKLGEIELADVIEFLATAAETLGSSDMGKHARKLEKARKVIGKAVADLDKALSLVATVAESLDPEEDEEEDDDDLDDDDDDFDE